MKVSSPHFSVFLSPSFIEFWNFETDSEFLTYFPEFNPLYGAVKGAYGKLLRLLGLAVAALRKAFKVRKLPFSLSLPPRLKFNLLFSAARLQSYARRAAGRL